jgi:hypothetical protein
VIFLKKFQNILNCPCKGRFFPHLKKMEVVVCETIEKKIIYIPEPGCPHPHMARKAQDGLSIMSLQVLSSFLFHSELWG